MRFIEGIGYIDDSSYTVNNTGQTQSAANVNFDNLLAVETDKLNQQTATYNLDDIFKEAAEKYNVSYDLLKAIAYNESRFQADATSSAGAMGIMQLMPSTAAAMGVQDAYDPYQNIMGGAKLLSTLSDMYDGNQTLMIAAYNAGSGNVAKYGGIPPFKETQNYVAKVLATLQSGVDISGNVITTGVNTPSTSHIRQTNSSNITYSSIDRNTVLSYQEYQLLMTYFDTMMNIIASIGETDSNDSSNDDSLADLFKLGTQSAANSITSAEYTAGTGNISDIINMLSSTEQADTSEIRSILASSITYNRNNIDL